MEDGRLPIDHYMTALKKKNLISIDPRVIDENVISLHLAPHRYMCNELGGGGESKVRITQNEQTQSVDDII